MKSNPFFELYVGDRFTSREFVTIFSDYLVPHALPIFIPGNVVVTGIQGSGKSMLLGLLQPTVRIEYDAEGEDFPVPEKRRKFISASVNLAHQSAIDFGLRKDIDEDPEEIEFLFADFLNYLIVDGFLKSLNSLVNGPAHLRTEVGLQTGRSAYNEVAPVISDLSIWEGWLGPCSTFVELQERIQRRIRIFRRYLHRKDKVLDPSISNTRTQIGHPIRDCIVALKTAGIVDNDTSLFVDVDQYEELGNISSRNTEGKKVDYRSVINRALAARDAAVSYRIGARGHAWRRHSRIQGTDARLEEERDYKYVDLDILLKRKEDQRIDIFPNFARDVFVRRLKFAGFRDDLLLSANQIENSDEVEPADQLETVYGPQLKASERVNKLNIRQPEKILKLEASWRPETRNKLKELAASDLLSAKLGEIWIRQKGDKYDLNVPNSKLPWQDKSYWRKERREAAALQIASQAHQRPYWCGADEIVGLSGGNILVFLSLNQFIWDTWIQYAGEESEVRSTLPKIAEIVQSIGILKASNFWIEKMAQETGRSSERLQFVNLVAEKLAAKLFSDEKLSNPGHTGFSLSEHELKEMPEVLRFLEELSDYGNMLMLDHTTKNRDRRQRKKFYFHPVFCPHFRIPYIRTKEPYYAKVSEVANWIYESGYKSVLSNKIQNEERSLFDQ
ncbi:hypothetical protein TRICHSKD4_0562 [Roseibium sp. TrichSKD4]|uniref:ORC-CDC6 family AAA ATPase n=1 Tax=Roseibium sp. TrichSKD4 TaxID=744980 RepID=UPI0001E5654A|nr:hypothetical protein [Roseibium sp. TrichSKD4]EFO34073.1 hypothetical protein TRICHSKD4_0562 [Roseibium sp. TrichSKD4]